MLRSDLAALVLARRMSSSFTLCRLCVCFDPVSRLKCVCSA